MDQHIVSLFVMQINSNVFSEHKLINPNDEFDNVVWSDETTVQLEIHRRFCYRKDGEKPRPKPRPKHPMSGLESARKVLLLCAFLRELWRLLCIVRSWNVHFSHSYDRNFHLHAHTGQRSKTYISSSSKLLFPVRHQLVVQLQQNHLI